LFCLLASAPASNSNSNVSATHHHQGQQRLISNSLVKITSFFGGTRPPYFKGLFLMGRSFEIINAF
jgi:hypothetical protein